jgi:hexulose-6-phosphate isomerase
MLRASGFDGVEIDSPSNTNMAAVYRASQKTGLAIDGSVDSKHWETRLTDPRDTVREQALQDLLTALRDTRTVGGHSVLLVPGMGTDGTREETWDRAIAQIRRALPLAARLGVYILIENVWNRMFYDHDGPGGQTADDLAAFVDQLESPWVGVQFDVGNHVKYGDPAAWIRRLGRRIVKLDIKDWDATAGFCRLGEGQVNWPQVRQALDAINYQGWAAAEVEGGDRAQLQDVSRRMDQVLGLK